MRKFSKSGVGFVVAYIIIAGIIIIWPVHCSGGFAAGAIGCGFEKLIALFPGIIFLTFYDQLNPGFDMFVPLLLLALVFNFFFYYFLGKYLVKIGAPLLQKFDKFIDKIGL